MEPVPKRNRRVKSTKNQNVKKVTKPCRDFLETTEHDYGLIRKIDGPFDASKFTTGVAEFDKENLEDVNHAVTYVTDIFQRLYISEVRIGIAKVLNLLFSNCSCLTLFSISLSFFSLDVYRANQCHHLHIWIGSATSTLQCGRSSSIG